MIDLAPPNVKLNRIPRRRVADAVLQQIRGLLYNESLRSGQRLPTELQLCAGLGASRTSVREALRVLEAEGLIVVKPGLGTFANKVVDRAHQVALTSDGKARIEGLADVWEVRQIIEVQAVKLAALRATAPDVQAMEEAAAAMEVSAAAGNMAEVILHDTTFHQAIIKATRNRLLLRMSQQIVHSLIEYRRRVLAAPTAPSKAMERHRAILDAVKARDPEAAAGLMLEHLRGMAPANDDAGEAPIGVA